MSTTARHFMGSRPCRFHILVFVLKSEQENFQSAGSTYAGVISACAGRVKVARRLYRLPSACTSFPTSCTFGKRKKQQPQVSPPPSESLRPLTQTTFLNPSCRSF